MKSALLPAHHRAEYEPYVLLNTAAPMAATSTESVNQPHRAATSCSRWKGLGQTILLPDLPLRFGHELRPLCGHGVRRLGQVRTGVSLVGCILVAQAMCRAG